MMIVDQPLPDVRDFVCPALEMTDLRIATESEQDLPIPRPLAELREPFAVLPMFGGSVEHSHFRHS
jgi:hypothetical protein